MIALYLSSLRIVRLLAKTGSQIIFIGPKNNASKHVHGRALIESGCIIAISLFLRKQKNGVSVDFLDIIH